MSSGSGNRCPSCGGKLSYNSVYDARYCAPCNVWTEPKCCTKQNKGCEFKCWKRPERPLMEAGPRVRRVVEGMKSRMLRDMGLEEPDALREHIDRSAKHLDDGEGRPACGAAARMAVLVDDKKFVTCSDCRAMSGMTLLN